MMKQLICLTLLLLVLCPCTVLSNNSHQGNRHGSHHGRASVSHLPKVAVCISGQISRWLPESTVPYLIAANSHAYDFTFFFNLQYFTKFASFIYSTDSHISFQPTKFLKMEKLEALQYIHSLYTLENTSRIGSFTYASSKSTKEWENDVFGGHPLNRITQYTDIQYVILNFWAHQQRCLSQIREYENLHSSSFSYVLSTREDVVYFAPVNMTFLTSQLKSPFFANTSAGTSTLLNSSSSSSPPPSLPVPPPSGTCDFITKDCLSWGGINMRWQLMTRETATLVIGKRVEYYHYLITSNQTIYNPEQYELAQLKHYGVKICEFDANIIPNIVGRHVMNDQICFLKPETIDNCAPSANASYVQQNLCHLLRKGLRNRDGGAAP